MNAHTWWYVARATGMVAQVALAASGILGAIVSGRLLLKKGLPAWATDVHRFLGGFAVLLTGIHLGALLADSYTHFRLIDIVIPFASEWKPGPVAWGVVALWLMLAVEVTSLAMKRLPRRTWKRIHLASYLTLWASLVHGITAGTDAANLIWVGMTAFAIAALTATTLARVLMPLVRPGRSVAS